MTHVSPIVINDAFRGYEDDVSGAITAQTPIAAVDTNWTQDVDTKFHVALLATETAGGDAKSIPFRFEYNLNGGGWLDVTNTTPIQAVSATNCTTADAASYGTTALTTGATIQATEYDTGGADAAPVSLLSSSFEFTTCLQIDSAQVANNDTIQLRLSNAGVALDADTTIPTITVSELANTVVNTNVPDALLLSEQQSTITLDENITTNAPDALVITEQQASIDLGFVVDTNTETLVLTEQSATVTSDFNVTTGAPDALVLAEQTASVTTGSNTEVNTNLATLTLTEQAATLSYDVDVGAGLDTLTLTEQTATVNLNVDVGATTDALALTEQQGTVTLDINVQGVVDTLALTEQNASVTLGVNVSTNLDTLLLQEQQASLTLDRNVNTNVVALSLTENQASIILDVDVSTNTETLALTELPATIQTTGATNVNAGTDTLEITELPATVANDVNVDTATDVLVLTEQPADIRFGKNVGTNVETLTLTGQTASVVNDVNIDSTVVELNITGLPAGVTVAVRSVTCTLVDRSGTALTGLSNLSWAWFDSTDPVNMVAPTDKGELEETDGTGLIEVNVPNSNLAAGQSGTLILRSDAGNLFGAYNLEVA